MYSSSDIQDSTNLGSPNRLELTETFDSAGLLHGEDIGITWLSIKVDSLFALTKQWCDHGQAIRAES